jgi:alpha-ribazole phosphatase/probable phosphoglycerate mutase
MASDDQTITRLWLVRHGEPHAEIRGRCYGRLDAGLSDVGRLQLEQVGRDLATTALAAIYASPRLRTRESAELIARYHHCAVQVDEQLREIDFGDFEGLAYDEIARRYPVEYQRWMDHPTEVQFPNGESFQAMRQRVLSAASELICKHAGETIAIVTHGGVNRILLADALGIPETNLFRIGQGYGARNLIQHIDGYPSVELMNTLPEPYQLNR